VSVDSLVGRPVPADQLRAGGSLYQVDLVPLRLSAVDGGDAVYVAPETVQAALTEVQSRLATGDARPLVVVTRDELTHAPIRGLVRSAQSEHPGRFQLVDTDDGTA